MTGPPTPPPTTVTEIEDASRSSVPPQPAPIPILVGTPAPQAEQPQPTPNKHLTPYEALFASVSESARNGDLHELILVAERGDLTTGIDSHHTRLFIIAPLVLAYMTLDELAAARYALARLPEALAAMPISTALFRLLASAWERKHEAVYARAEEVFKLCQQPAFENAELASVLAGMVTAFGEAFRTKTFTLLGKAYTSISMPLAQSYLGLPAERVLTVATANGWTFDASTQVLTPPSPGSQLNGSSKGPSTLLTFKSVAA